MRPFQSGLLIAGLLGAGPAFAQDSYWVDPVAGADSAAHNGSAQDPFQTLSYAVGRQLPGRRLTVHLLPGRYLSEVWPIDVGPDALAVEAEFPGTAYVYGFGTSNDNFRLGPGSGDLALRGLTLRGAQNIIRLQGPGPPGSVLRISLDRMFCVGGVLVNAVATGDLALQVECTRTWFRGVAAGLQLRAWGAARIDARVRRSRLFRGAICVDAKTFGDQAEIDVLAENTLLVDALVNAVRLESGGGRVHAEILHCNLAGNGDHSIPGLPAVKLIQPAAGAPFPTAAIRRSILWNNGGDVYWFAGTAPNFSFETNLVEDPALAGLGGNIQASPEWLSGSFLCGPASPARGAAPPGVPVDILGRPRSSSASDIGAFEHTALTLGLGLSAFAGLTQNISVSGPPQTQYAVVAGFRRALGPGLGVRPFAVANPLFRGRLDAAGFAGRGFLLPRGLGLEGRRIFYQAVGLDPAGVVLRSRVVVLLVSIQV